MTTTATRPPLTARPDWALTPPDDSGAWEPCAYLVGGDDGWDLYWTRKGTEDPGENGPEEGTEIPWPFDNEAFAEDQDFKALGFRVEG